MAGAGDQRSGGLWQPVPEPVDDRRRLGHGQHPDTRGAEHDRGTQEPSPGASRPRMCGRTRLTSFGTQIGCRSPMHTSSAATGRRSAPVGASASFSDRSSGTSSSRSSRPSLVAESSGARSAILGSTSRSGWILSRLGPRRPAPDITVPSRCAVDGGCWPLVAMEGAADVRGELERLKANVERATAMAAAS